VVTLGNEQSVSQKQTTADLVHLVRKFRWMGMEDEAIRVQTALARCLALYECSPSLENYLERQEVPFRALSTERNPSGTR
jgi:hypothetical protein